MPDHSLFVHHDHHFSEEEVYGIVPSHYEDHFVQYENPLEFERGSGRRGGLVLIRRTLVGQSISSKKVKKPEGVRVVKKKARESGTAFLKRMKVAALREENEREYQRQLYAHYKKERFLAQEQAQRILSREGVAYCLKTLGYESHGVLLLARKRKEGGFYGSVRGVKWCNSTWGCPVCGYRKAQVARAELRKALSQHTARGGHAMLLTLTFQHHRDNGPDGLKKLLGPLNQATTDFKQSAIWRSLPLDGHVTSSEVTFGVDNGWHPHKHMLLFCEAGETGSMLRADQVVALEDAWLHALEKNGLKGKRGVALDLRAGNAAANYIAKWGMEDEMTQSESKEGRYSVTMFDALLFSSDEYAKSTGATPEEQDAFAELYAMYYEAYKGTKRLTWSPKLKAKFNLSEESEEVEDVPSEQVEESEESEETEPVVFSRSVSIQAWKLIWKVGLMPRFMWLFSMGLFDDVLSIIDRAELRVRGVPPPSFR